MVAVPLVFAVVVFALGRSAWGRRWAGLPSGRSSTRRSCWSRSAPGSSTAAPPVTETYAWAPVGGPELRLPRRQPEPPGRARDDHRLRGDRGLLHGLHEAQAGGHVRGGEEEPVLALLPQLHAPRRRAARRLARDEPDRALPLRGADAHPVVLHGRPLRLHEQGEDRDHVLRLEPPRAPSSSSPGYILAYVGTGSFEISSLSDAAAGHASPTGPPA